MSSHFRPGEGLDPTHTCWNCYFYDGEMSGPHPVCHEEWPLKTVIALPDHGCAFFQKPPAPGEPKPLVRSERRRTR